MVLLGLTLIYLHINMRIYLFVRYDEPNRNIQWPPPQKNDVGSSKTKAHFDAFMVA
jgi:hypothetical protein